MIALNATVSGTYYGVNYTGKVSDRRLHTARFDCIVYYIALDAPVTVLGATREEICIHAVNGTGIDGESFVKEEVICDLQTRCDDTERLIAQIAEKHKDFSLTMAITAANNLRKIGIYSL